MPGGHAKFEGEQIPAANGMARRVKLGRKPKLIPQAIKRHDAGEPVREIACGVASGTSVLPLRLLTDCEGFC
jgi:hypothetical protein